MKEITEEQELAWVFSRQYPKLKNYYRKYKARYKLDYTGDYDLEYEKNLKFLRSILMPIYFNKIEPLKTLTMSQRFHLMMEPWKEVLVEELTKPNILLDKVKKDNNWVGGTIEIPIKKDYHDQSTK